MTSKEFIERHIGFSKYGEVEVESDRKSIEALRWFTERNCKTYMWVHISGNTLNSNHGVFDIKERFGFFIAKVGNTFAKVTWYDLTFKIKE